ncbi:hypothetical protein [Nostoc sp. JL33]|uniref:hypothetical protein n=1 Tax=Nostoc sp. JL33 TaxID=2815396 RepID=UPI0025E864CD|nr:hypothetical protein [Nostoc sp. JL33]MBN3873760.1 hypothetical protein [Nostoc sp. JL33]
MLWVVTPDSCYFIPSSISFAKESVNGVKLYSKWDAYKVSVPLPLQSESGEYFDSRKYKRRLTHEDKAKIDELIDQGQSQRQVPQLLEINRGTVNTYLGRKRKLAEANFLKDPNKVI